MKWTILILFILIILSLHTKWKHFKANREIQKNCSKISQKIFVCLMGETSSKNIALTLYNLFENASCPSNIKVALYEIVEDGDGKNLYILMSKKYSSIGKSFENNIVQLKRFAHDQGPYESIMDTIELELQDESFVCTINDLVHFNKDWDKNLIHQLNNNTNNKLVIVNNPKTFSYLKSFDKDQLPIVSLKKSLNEKKSIQYSKFWTRQFSFCSSKFWKNLKKRENLKHLSNIDIFLTCEFLIQNYMYFIIAEKEIYKLHENNDLNNNLGNNSKWGKSNKLSFESSKNLLNLLKHDSKLKSSLSFLGLLDKVDALAALGIVNENDAEEIISKYGSIADYKYLKTSF